MLQGDYGDRPHRIALVLPPSKRPHLPIGEPAAQPAGIAGLSVRDFKPTDFKSVVV